MLTALHDDCADSMQRVPFFFTSHSDTTILQATYSRRLGHILLETVFSASERSTAYLMPPHHLIRN